MSKKARLGGTVQISGKRYTVLAGPTRDGAWFRILAMNDEAGSYWAISEDWRGGCGPWKITTPVINEKA
jgi:hypothetical protein